MIYRYKTSGTCSAFIDVEMDGNILKHAEFYGGCNGNLQGISALTEGLSYEEIAERLGGIRCGYKSTSCPDQLVRAMKEAMESEAKQR